MSRMTVGSPLPFEVEKKALRPSGSKSLFRGKAPSIIRPSYSVPNSMYSFQSVGIGGKAESREGRFKQDRGGQTHVRCCASSSFSPYYLSSVRRSPSRPRKASHFLGP